VWHNNGEMAVTKRDMPPLDHAALERMALRYVERFATTRARLASYLRRKIVERGWDGPAADPVGIAARMAELGYVDDRAFAEAKAKSMARRGLGARRVTAAWRAAGVEEEDACALSPEVAERAVEAAFLFARRRRFGPFAAEQPDRARREKQVAAMVRAGHGADLSRRIVRMAPGEDVNILLDG